MSMLKNTVVILVLMAANGFTQEKIAGFIPSVFWGNNTDKGIILIAPADMMVIDSKGVKYGRILSSEPVFSAYLSPDGDKIAYTTSTGLWLAELASGKSSLVVRGACDYLRWNSDGLSVLFAIYEKKGHGDSEIFTAKFFLADGDGEGKNIKQIYP